MDYTDSEQGEYDWLEAQHSEEEAIKNNLDSLNTFEQWARSAVLKFGTKDQLEWTEDIYVLVSLQILPGLISRFRSEILKSAAK